MAADLLAAIASGDAAACMAFLNDMPEAERRTHAREALAAYKVSGPQRASAYVAVLGTASLAQIKKGRVTGWSEQIYAVLANRRPEWLKEWCEWSLNESTRSHLWPVVRRFVREGLCERPETDRYYLWMADHATLGAKRTVREFLLSDPELLEHEVWELFRIEGDQRVSLASADKYAKNKPGWARTLAELAQEGVLSRARLLDASLDALERDFPQYRAGWFSRFHEELKPTAAERAQRSDRYLRLMTSKIPPTVAFALKAVQVLQIAGHVSPEQIAHFIPPAFYAKEKSTVLLALRLSECSPNIADIAAPALEHSSRDVREAVRAVLSGGTEERPAAIPLPAHAPIAPTTEQPTEPLRSVEDLVEVFSRVIENEGPPADLERVLDGVSRLCAERPPDYTRLTGALLKRVRRPGKRGQVATCFEQLAIAWLTGKVADYEPPKRRPGLQDFLALRVREVAERASRAIAQPLLAAPTGPGGWIDPAIFVERMNQTVEPARLDLIQALLRLERDGRFEALDSLPRFNETEPDAAVRFAASQVRNPDATSSIIRLITRSHTASGKEYRYTGVKVHYAEPFKIPEPVTDYPTLLAHLTGCEEPSMLRWTATVWPQHRDGWLTGGCLRLGNNLEWWQAEWSNRVYLEPLLDPRTTFSVAALSLLALGLAAKEPGEGTLATDVLVHAISSERLRSPELSRLLLFLFDCDVVNLGRVAKRLSRAAAESTLHAAIIQEGIAIALTEKLPQPAVNLGHLLECFFEMSIAINAPPPTGDLVLVLNSITGANRAASMARKLLQRRAETSFSRPA